MDYEDYRPVYPLNDARRTVRLQLIQAEAYIADSFNHEYTQTQRRQLVACLSEKGADNYLKAYAIGRACKEAFNAGASFAGET